MLKSAALFSFFLALFTIAVFAQVPEKIAYQGLLTDNNSKPVADGNYSIVFNIYSASTGGSLLWSEIQQLDVKSGVINTVLGKTNPLDIDFSGPYLLGISVNGEQEMLPRV